MPERWIQHDELVEAAKGLSGWSDRGVQRRAKARKIRWRDSKNPRVNGRRFREYLVSSLPIEVQEKLVQNFSQVSGPDSAPAEGVDLQLTFWPPQDAQSTPARVPVTTKQQEQIDFRFTVIRPLIELASLKTKKERLEWFAKEGLPVMCADDLAKQIAQINGVGRSTIWGWYRLYGSGPGALLDRVRRDKGKSRWFAKHPKAAVYVLGKVLKENLAVRAIHRAMERDVAILDLHADGLPTRDTIAAFIDSQPKAPMILARQGERKFNEDCLPYLERAYTDVAANHIWVADHMISDVRVWDDCFKRDGKALRLRLTMILDFRSRRALGYTFCLEGSSTSIATAIRNAILRFGPCAILYCDNGKDFKKIAKGASNRDWWKDEIDRIKGLLGGLGIRAQHCMKYHGQSKNVERSFRTDHQQFDAMFVEGYTTGNAYARSDATRLAEKEHERLLNAGEVETSPLCPASVYIESFAAWVENEYNRRPHGGQGMDGRSPNAVYDELYPAESRPRIELDKVAHLFCERARVKVDSCNVTAGCHKYEGATPEAACALFLRNTTFVYVAYDKNDPKTAVALDGDGAVIAPLQLKPLVPHSEAARPIIAESMAERRRMRNATADAIQRISDLSRGIGTQTEREHLEIAAGFDVPAKAAAADSSVLITLPSKGRTTAAQTEPENTLLPGEGADRLAARLKRRMA